MPKYQFEVELGPGKYKRATVSAPNLDEAQRRSLTLAGGCPVRNLEVIQGSSEDQRPVVVPPANNPFKPFQPWWQRIFWRTKKRVDLQQLSMFSRQFATLLHANVPMIKALECFFECPEPEPIHEVVEDICSKVEQGHSLSSAMSNHPLAFNSIYCGMVHSGETTGRLSDVLNQLADQLEKDLRLKKKLGAALTYPIILMLAAVASVFFFLGVILPVLEPLFADTHVALPLPTRILLQMRGLAPWGLVGVVAMGVGVVLLRKRMKQQEKLRYSVHRMLIHIPYFGYLYQRLTIARVLQSMATMFEVGLSTLPILRACEGLTSNQYLMQKLALVRKHVVEGEPMSEAMLRADIFPSSVVHLVSAGEESSQLSTLLEKGADVIACDNESALETLPQVIEPLIMLGMGLVVGFVILATLLPIINLIEGL